jgi:2-desacetyl-2-hydroxyethyl bacteriochlorophyllide A dehydrogenase
LRAVEIAEDRSLVAVDRPEPQPGPGQVVVQVARCGICGSDLHLRPSPAIPAGTVMGHEFAGRIAAIGDGVEGWREGERVCVYPFIPCGECPMCEAGHEHVCMQAAVTGIGLGANPGAYAERIVVDASTLFHLPDTVSDDAGALVEPFAVGLHGIAQAEADPTEPALVIGAGPIGVMTALGLRARGFERVLVVERNERRARRIAELGFDALGLDGVHMAVLEACGGLPPPAIFECAGNPAALGLALELIRPKGRIVALGVLEEPVPISQLVLLIKEAELHGSFAYTKADFADAIGLIADGALPVESLVTSVVELDRAEEMFGKLLAPDSDELKVLLAPAAL